MSYELNAALVTLFANDATITGRLAQDPDNAGVPAIYPYHHSDLTNPVYPLLTVARFGDAADSNRFNDSDMVGMMDHPRIAVCAYSKSKPDPAMAIIARIQQMIWGRSVGSSYIGTYRIDRTLYRDDLYDMGSQTYHVHSEWRCWVQSNFGARLAIPT